MTFMFFKYLFCAELAAMLMFVTCVEPDDVVTERFNTKQDFVFTFLTCKMIILIEKHHTRDSWHTNNSDLLLKSTDTCLPGSDCCC